MKHAINAIQLLCATLVAVLAITITTNPWYMAFFVIGGCITGCLLIVESKHMLDACNFDSTMWIHIALAILNGIAAIFPPYGLFNLINCALGVWMAKLAIERYREKTK